MAPPAKSRRRKGKPDVVVVEETVDEPTTATANVVQQEVSAAPPNSTEDVAMEPVETETDPVEEEPAPEPILLTQPVTDFGLVTYPGIVRNTARAIETLGGIRKLCTVFNKERPLELHRHPENMYERALVAANTDEHKQPHLTFVLKCSRKKPLESEASTSAASSQIHYELLGRVTSSYEFSAMADFQYVPIHRRPELEASPLGHAQNCIQTSTSGPVYEDLLPRLFPTDVAAAMSWWDNVSALSQPPDPAQPFAMPLFMPSFVMSRFGKPSIYTLEHSEVELARLRSTQTEMGRNTRGERKAMTITVTNEDAFPAAPSPAAVRDAELRIRLPEAHANIEALFAQRPIWTSASLIEKSQLMYRQLKVLLAKYAFYIQSGPWCRTWCKFGFDPRVQPDARQYQSVVVNFKLDNRFRHHSRIGVDRMKDRRDPQSVEEMRATYEFKSGAIPGIRHVSYCMCDVDLPSAKAFLTGPVTRAKCDVLHGWLPEEAIDMVRLDIREKVYEALATRQEQTATEQDDQTSAADAQLLLGDASINALRSYTDDVNETMGSDEDDEADTPYEPSATE